ncbi:MAG: transglycosylase domain-containing protein, partial [Clostridia bacterium]|nr:transglycosylase domain-containing protein [Clostridia bacterium]
MGSNKFKTNKKSRRTLKGIGKVFSIASICAIALMLITVCIVASAGIIYFDNYEMSDPIYLEDYASSQGNSVIYAYDSNGNAFVMQELQGEKNRVWTSINEIPKNLQNAVIAIEDERFYTHYGVDWKRTASAFLNEVVSIYGNQQGGSTITQQLIKNITGETQVTIERKFNEILQALELERRYSKTEILEAYLNEIYLSNNCHGVQAASRRYFDKDVSELNLAECATLAVITNAPTYYDPILNPDNNKVRQEYCLRKMLELGMISQEEYDEAVNFELVYKNGNTESEENQTNQSQFSYYTDYVIETVIADLMSEYGYSYNRARQMVMGGGLSIYSAVDLTVQEKIEYIYENKTAGFNDDALQSAAVLMEYDGRIVGMVGGAGEKTDSLSFNRAVHAKRPPGSTMKPLSVYSYGIENNWLTWSSLYLDKAIILNGKQYPQNVDGTFGTGKMITIQYALAHSTNTVAVRLAQELTVQKLFNFIQDTYHLTTLESSDMAISPVALGGMTYGVKVLEMAAAYQVFGNGGVYNTPYCYYEVKNSEGEVILSKKSEASISLSADSAWVMNKIMQTVMTPGGGGTGQRFGLSAYGIETFGKSGSTSDYCDVWFCGGSPYYVAAIWTGFDESKPLNVYAGNTSG